MPDFYDGGHQGDGPLVVLIHGAGGNHTVWRYQSRYLANRNFRVMAFDLPGHGSNAHPPLETVEEIAEWVAGRMPEPATVIGHSLGGLVALELARTRPELVARAALLACGKRMAVHPELLAAANDSARRAVQMLIGWSFDVAGRIGAHPEPGTSAARLVARIIEAELGNLGRDLAAVTAYQGGEAAAKSLAVETLVIAGVRDRLISPRDVKAMADAITGGQFVSFDRAGHFMMTDSPDEVRLALSTFLAIA